MRSRKCRKTSATISRHSCSAVRVAVSSSRSAAMSSLSAFARAESRPVSRSASRSAADASCLCRTLLASCCWVLRSSSCFCSVSYTHMERPDHGHRVRARLPRAPVLDILSDIQELRCQGFPSHTTSCHPRICTAITHKCTSKRDVDGTHAVTLSRTAKDLHGAASTRAGQSCIQPAVNACYGDDLDKWIRSGQVGLCVHHQTGLDGRSQFSDPDPRNRISRSTPVSGLGIMAQHGC